MIRSFVKVNHLFLKEINYDFITLCLVFLFFQFYSNFGWGLLHSSIFSIFQNHLNISIHVLCSKVEENSE